MQKELHCLHFVQSLGRNKKKHILTSWGGNAASYVLLPNNRLIPMENKWVVKKKLLAPIHWLKNTRLPN